MEKKGKAKRAKRSKEEREVVGGRASSTAVCLHIRNCVRLPCARRSAQQVQRSLRAASECDATGWRSCCRSEASERQRKEEEKFVLSDENLRVLDRRNRRTEKTLQRRE